MNGSSYRVKETKNWILQQQQATDNSNTIAKKSAEKTPNQMVDRTRGHFDGKSKFAISTKKVQSLRT